MSYKVPLAGVIGHPIGHSKSPALHGHWLRHNDIVGHYVPLDISPDDLLAALRMLPKIGYVGANVTIPHKEAALALADHVSERAQRIGAANTLTFGDTGEIYADNTDGIGFMANLQQNAPNWNAVAGPAMVLGAGGAAKAIICALLDAGVPELRLTNRTRSRAEMLRDQFGERVHVVEWSELENNLSDLNLLVNTTSLGMQGQPALTISLNQLSKAALVTDIVYAPLMTPLLKQAKEQGNQVVDGLGMLLHQAAPGFSRWFKVEPVVTEALRKVVLEQ